MGRLLDRLKDRAPGLHRFLTRKDRPWPVVRELAFGVAGILVVVALLFGLTGQPLVGGYPVVVVTSGSMMHCDNYPDFASTTGKGCDASSYGRIGTIDPGDLVFVRNVDDHQGIATKASAGGSTYGAAGDVVVYRPNGSAQATPIIHRALFYLQVNTDGTFTIDELGLSHVDRLDQKVVTDLTNCPLPLSAPHLGPQGSGLVTRGDNNVPADQCGQILPVRDAWILGKARGEVPWIGLVNLLVGDITGGSNNFGNAGSDSKTMLVVIVVLVVAVPYAWRVVQRRRGKGDAE